MRRLDLKSAARADLQHIYDYGAAEFGPPVAEAYLAGLKSVFDRLVDYSMLGPVYWGVQPEMRVIPYRSHRIFYQLNADIVLIVRILHNRRDEWAALQ